MHAGRSRCSTGKDAGSCSAVEQYRGDRQANATADDHLTTVCIYMLTSREDDQRKPEDI